MKRLILILLLFTVKISLAATPEDIFAQANEAYKRSEYIYAAELFEQIVDKGFISADLFYNLGNAYFKSNNLGRAILNYERALRLRPMDEDIQHNLSVARSRIVDRIEQRPMLFYERWWQATYNLQGVDGWAITTVIVLVFFLSSLGIYLFSRIVSLKKGSFFAALIFFIVLVHAFIFTIKQYNRITSHSEAVVLQARTTAKSAPSAQSTDLFLLHEGTKVSVRSSLGDWIEIALPNGSVGWVRSETTETI